MDKKEICFHVGTHNCAESNLFLRKFYEVMSHSMEGRMEFPELSRRKKYLCGKRKLWGDVDRVSGTRKD